MPIYLALMSSLFDVLSSSGPMEKLTFSNNGLVDYEKLLAE
jgi:hypothetical protein